MKFIIGLLLCALIGAAWCQKNLDSLHSIGVCTEDGYCIPSLRDLPRGKGLELFQERTPNYNLNTTYVDSDSNFTNRIRRTKNWSAKLKLPVINKDHLKFIVGFKYGRREFAFEDEENIDNAFHQSLKDKPIRTVGLSAYSVHSFQGNKYLAFRGTLRLNGDFESDKMNEHLKTSISGLFGVKVNRFKTWGYGLSYSNTFGRSSIYPILFYRNFLKDKWVIETTLPVSASILFMPNKKNNIYFHCKLEGDNYNLNFDGFRDDPLFLESSDLKTFFTYERELYDFLWLGLSGGMRWNINFDISDSDAYFERAFPIGSTDNLAITNSLSDAFFARIGIFIVAPRKWLER